LEKLQEAKEPPAKSWLDKFVSKSGERLPEESKLRTLQAITDWARQKTDSLEEEASTWRKNPSVFCGTTHCERYSERYGIIGLYFDEYEQIENSKTLNPVRRKVILVNTFEAVVEVENDLRASKKRKRAKKAHVNPAVREPSYRSKAIDVIANRAWGDSTVSLKERKRRRAKLQRMVRFGEKWSSIRPKGLILGLGYSQW
jgi:hypothetical protein